MNSINFELQPKDTEFEFRIELIDLLTKLEGFKLVATLVIEFKKTESDGPKHTTFYFNSETETIINKSDIDDVIKSMYSKIILHIQKCLGKGSGWIID